MGYEDRLDGCGEEAEGVACEACFEGGEKGHGILLSGNDFWNPQKSRRAELPWNDRKSTVLC